MQRGTVAQQGLLSVGIKIACSDLDDPPTSFLLESAMPLRIVLSLFTLLLSLSLWGVACPALAQSVLIEDARLELYIQDDILTKRYRMRYQLEKNGKRYFVVFRGLAPRDVANGQRVSVRAKLKLRRRLHLRASPSNFKVLTRAAEGAPVAGVKQALVLKIQSPTSVSAATTAQISSTLQTMDLWYQEASFGALSVKNDRANDGQADIYTVTIDQASAGVGEGMAFTFCRSAQTNAATQHAITPSQWDNIICILPPDMNYGWFGQAYVPGREMVISGNHAGSYPGGYTHELGHNLGMHHANTPGVEYGETACVMGGNASTGRRHFNGPHKSQMGWLDAQTVASGSFTLNAVELAPAARVGTHSVLKVRDTTANQDLYISYRAPSGTFSSSLPQPLTTAVHSHSSNGSQTIRLAALADGQSFTQNGVTVRQVSHDANRAVVEIVAPCSTTAPLLNFVPSSFSSAQALPTRYTVSVQNRDPSCNGSTSFALSALLPSSSWSATLSSSTLTLAPGQSAEVQLEVTPPANVNNATYTVQLRANATGHTQGSGSALYVKTAASALPAAPLKLRVMP